MMTTSEFADAIQKGLGRAVLAVDSFVSEDFAKVILTACVEDQRYDRQLEDGRSDYLMSLVVRAELVDQLLPILLVPVCESAVAWDRNLQIDMLGQFARRSESRAWDALVRYANELNGDAFDVIASVGPQGVEWFVENVLDRIPADEKWRVKFWAEEIEGLSESTILALKKAEREFDDWKPTRSTGSGSKRPETFEEAMEAIQNGAFYINVLQAIGANLTDEQVLQVAHLWLEESEFRPGNTYRRLFEVREFPLPVEEITQRIRAGKPPIRFEDMLSRINDPQARELGLQLLTQAEPDWRGFNCLLGSFIEEDIPILVQTLTEFETYPAEDIHSIGMSLRGMAKKFTPGPRLSILKWVYENTPCSLCRNGAVELMIKDNSLPESYRLELEFDADSYSRQLVTKLS